ncbi:MAG TPA: M23 family metallopeptidase [Hyphomicrobiales bacterium]|nr:M23 family metallopeptidase [Hyphomicrobiales bacterium]
MPTHATLAHAAHAEHDRLPPGAPHPAARHVPLHSRSEPVAAPLRRPARAALVLGRRAAAAWTVVVLALLGWSAASTSYIVFRDQILQDIRLHHAAAERAAATQMAALNQEIDRLKSARMAEQAALGEEIESLMKREALLAHRQAALGEFGLAAPESGTIATLPKKPRPVDDSAEPRSPPKRARESRAAPIRASGRARLAALSDAYDAIEARQAAAVVHFQSRLDRERGELSELYRRLGVGEPTQKDVGGPYIPLSQGPLRGDPAFNHALGRVAAMQADIRRLKQGLIHLPVRSPLDTNELEETSGFGSRPDPFYHSLAFHPGLDLRAAYGAPVEATAAGKVVTAGWNGGYGNMVEIDHGNGVATRYGHLSQIEVKVGAHVEAGEEIGRVGSTGRSTGPHLHYEVRLDNEPVDPTRFLTATNHLAAATDDAGSAD